MGACNGEESIYGHEVLTESRQFKYHRRVDMEQQEERYMATQVAIAWMLLLLVKVFSFSAAILFSIYENNGFQSLAGDPGPQTARAFLYVFWVISVMPIYVFAVAK
jgi:hypothetical protein